MGFGGWCFFICGDQNHKFKGHEPMKLYIGRMA